MYFTFILNSLALILHYSGTFAPFQHSRYIHITTQLQNSIEDASTEVNQVEMIDYF